MKVRVREQASPKVSSGGRVFGGGVKATTFEKERLEILFATMETGGGHVATSRAMSEAIERHNPGEFDLRISDYVKDLGLSKLDRANKDSWRLALRYPFLARAGQRFIDSFPHATVAALARMMREFSEAAAEDLASDPPSLVVSNHGVVTTALAEAKRLYGLEVPVLTFATEPYNISAYWADPRADHVVVPSEGVRQDLLDFGVPENKLTVIGYPVRQAFLSPLSKKEARDRLGLDDEFTCLVSFGGEGVAGNQYAMIRSLLEMDFPVRVIVLTGKNRAFREKLRPLQGDSGRLRVEGFVDNVADYLAASDVVAGKAGPASVYEALAVGRPVLITGYAGLNERGVAQFVEGAGLGSYVKTPAAFSREVRRYAEDPKLLQKVAERCEPLDLASQTGRLARYVADYARTHERVHEKVPARTTV